MQQVTNLSTAGIFVVALGAHTAVGRTAAASSAAVRARICRYRQHTYMTSADGEPVSVAAAPWLEPDVPLGQRIQALCSGAAREAVQPLLGFLPHLRGYVPRLGVVVATSDDRPGLPRNFALGLKGALEEVLGQHLPGTQVEVCSSGQAAGVVAMMRGFQALSAGAPGSPEFYLVGGADSHLGPESLLQLEKRRQLHGEDNPWGFIPGEAAGFCLLASKVAAQHYGLRPLLELVSVAVSREPNTLGGQGVCIGAGLSRAVAEVLQACPVPAVDVILSDQNGETYRADEFGFTLARYARRFAAPPDFRTPATCWGDVGAASVPLFAGLVAASGQRGYAFGDYGLVLASSESDQRGAVLVRLSSCVGK